jgi:hypothetical protein
MHPSVPTAVPKMLKSIIDLIVTGKFNDLIITSQIPSGDGSMQTCECNRLLLAAISPVLAESITGEAATTNEIKIEDYNDFVTICEIYNFLVSEKECHKVDVNDTIWKINLQELVRVINLYGISLMADYVKRNITFLMQMVVGQPLGLTTCVSHSSNHKRGSSNAGSRGRGNGQNNGRGGRGRGSGRGRGNGQRQFYQARGQDQSQGQVQNQEQTQVPPQGQNQEQVLDLSQVGEDVSE